MVEFERLEVVGGEGVAREGLGVLIVLGEAVVGVFVGALSGMGGLCGVELPGKVILGVNN